VKPWGTPAFAACCCTRLPVAFRFLNIRRQSRFQRRLAHLAAASLRAAAQFLCRGSGIHPGEKSQYSRGAGGPACDASGLNASRAALRVVKSWSGGGRERGRANTSRRSAGLTFSKVSPIRWGTNPAM